MKHYTFDFWMPDGSQHQFTYLAESFKEAKQMAREDVPDAQRYILVGGPEEAKPKE